MAIDKLVPMRQTFRMAKAPASETSRLLQTWIEKNDLTQQRAADKIGVNLRQVQYWLNGGTPQGKNVEKLAKAMGLKVGDFYPTPIPMNGDVLERLDLLESRFDIAEEDILDRISKNSRRLSSIEAGIDEIRELLVALIGSTALAESLPEAVARRRDDLVRALETSQRRAAEARPGTQNE